MPFSALGLLVHSVTRHWIRLSVGDADRLLLATRVRGAPLSVGTDIRCGWSYPADEDTGG